MVIQSSAEMSIDRLLTFYQYFTAILRSRGAQNTHDPHNFEKKKRDSAHTLFSNSSISLSGLRVTTDSAGFTLYSTLCTLTLNDCRLQGENRILFVRNLMKLRETLTFGETKFESSRDQSLSNLLYSKTKKYKF